MKMKEVQILQITPAAGFNGVFSTEEATVFTRPIACWALVRRTLVLNETDWEHLDDMDANVAETVAYERGKPLEITRVEGLTSNMGRELEMCESDEYFLGYIGPGENPLDFQEKARDLIDSFIEAENDEQEFDTDAEEIADGLPQALSHLSVQIQERLRKGDIPRRWEQGGWLEFMRRFGDLSGGYPSSKKEASSSS